MSALAQDSAISAAWQQRRTNVGRLLVQGRDRPGIVAAVSKVLSAHGANILSLRQHTSDPDGGYFFQRTVFDLPDLDVTGDHLQAELDSGVGQDLELSCRVYDAARRKRVAIFVSKTDHCLLELLWRQRRGEIDMEIVTVVSNHPDLKHVVGQFGVPFVHVPTSGDRGAAEREHLDVLRGRVDLVILARYMQILSEEFLDNLGVPVINIHHSFLPAFIGAAPYKKARQRGVKLIGATAHYATRDLDEGPIIEQDVVRVTHADTVGDLVRHGADVERMVLSRAVKWHCDDRVIQHGNQTVVFT